MSFEKVYPNRKDRRKPYYKKAQRDDSSCRCHGGCPWCERNKQFFDKKRRSVADKELKDFNLNKGANI